jgi:hypothetical protein
MKRKYINSRRKLRVISKIATAAVYVEDQQKMKRATGTC